MATIPTPAEYRIAVKTVQTYHKHVKNNHARELALRIIAALKLSQDAVGTIEEILRDETKPEPKEPEPTWSNQFPVTNGSAV